MILEALSYAFMQKALIAGVAVGIICTFMGTFLVLRRYSLFGDGIAHVAFGGISVGLFLGVFPLWTAFIVSIFGGLGLQKLRQSTKISGDSAVAVVLVSGLAVGVILVSSSGGFSVDLFSFLFGSILLISQEDTIMILEALSYAFMQKALIAGVAVGILCSFMGTFLVLRRYSLFGDGIAHVAFGGISVGLFLGVFPLSVSYTHLTLPTIYSV